MATRYRIDITFGPESIEPVDPEVERQLEAMRVKMWRVAELAGLDDFGPATKDLRAALRIEHNAPAHLRARAEAITDRIAAKLRERP
jgi:hypothetical protein